MTTLVSKLNMITILHTDLLDQIKLSWTHDPRLVQLIKHLQQPSHKPSKYTWEAGQLCRKGKLIVGLDAALRTELLDHFHGSAVGGHPRVQQTMARIRGVVYWKGLKKNVRQYIWECSICQQCKYDTTASPGLIQPLLCP